MNKIILSFAVIMAICFGACAQNKEKQNTDTKKILVAYFSATGTTAELARAVRDVTRGDLYEIVPEEAYTPADLDWNDSRSRSSLEMGDTLARPALKSPGADVSGYDVIFIGYPIWWNEAPRVVNTFIESVDLRGKTIVPFATSGGSGIDNSVSKLKAAYPDLQWKEGRLFNSPVREAIKSWASQY